MRLLLISDTHIPTRTRDLPPSVWDEVARADIVIHAGDWVSTGLLDQLEAAAKQLIGCYGNNDGPELRARIPETVSTELAGVRVTVIHETGSTKGREQRLDRLFPQTDLLIFGHSHIPWDTVTPNGMRLLNPGSPTDRRRQPHATFQTVELRDGRIDQVVLHQVT